MFSSTSLNGNVPTTDKIVSFWSRYKTAKKKDVIAMAAKNGISEEDVEEWVESALGPNNDPIGDDSVDTGNNNDVDVELNVEPTPVQTSSVLHKHAIVLNGCFKKSRLCWSCRIIYSLCRRNAANAALKKK